MSYRNYWVGQAEAPILTVTIFYPDPKGPQIKQIPLSQFEEIPPMGPEPGEELGYRRKRLVTRIFTDGNALGFSIDKISSSDPNIEYVDPRALYYHDDGQYRLVPIRVGEPFLDLQRSEGERQPIKFDLIQRTKKKLAKQTRPVEIVDNTMIYVLAGVALVGVAGLVWAFS